MRLKLESTVFEYSAYVAGGEMRVTIRLTHGEDLRWTIVHRVDGVSTFKLPNLLPGMQLNHDAIEYLGTPRRCTVTLGGTCAADIEPYYLAHYLAYGVRLN